MAQWKLQTQEPKFRFPGPKGRRSRLQVHGPSPSLARWEAEAGEFPQAHGLATLEHTEGINEMPCLKTRWQARTDTWGCLLTSTGHHTYAQLYTYIHAHT